MQHCLARPAGLQACSRPQPSHAQPACRHAPLWPAQRTVLLRRHQHKQPLIGINRVHQCRRALQPVRVAAVEPPTDAPESPDEDEEDHRSYVEVLQDCFDIPGFVEVFEGENGVPCVFLMHPNGHSLEIYLQGATITRWLKQDGKSIIFTRPDAVFEPGSPINSGVPIAFPQWREGQLPENGFADKLMWDLVCSDLGFEFMNMHAPPDGSEPVDLSGDLVQDEDGEWVAAEDEEELQGGEEVEDPNAAAGSAAADEAADVRRQRQEGDEGEEASTSGREDGLDVPDELMEEFVSGYVGDPSPYVILRLTDTSQTRDLWPHSFELLLKISLQESDDFDDPKAELPKGVLPFDDEGDLAAAAEMGPNDQDTAYDEDEEEEGGEVEEPDEEPLDLRRPVLDADDAPDVDDPFPMQVKMEFCLTHAGDPEEPPFEFQLAAMPHFTTLNQERFGRFVRCLGLGAKQAFDWSYDPRYARMTAMDDDYLTFGGRRIETAVINAHDADVRFCPGDRTHIELQSREGFKDAVVYHPGPLPPPGQEAFSPYYAVLGPGRVALPKRLKPGQEWRGEFVMRHHNRYWDPPVFDRRGLQPMPPLVPPEDEDEELADDDEEDEGEAGEGGEAWDADYASDDEEFDIGPGM